MLKSVSAHLAVAASLFSSSALAATGTITFSGTVGAACTLTVVNSSGTMTASSTMQSLSSKNPGGTPGVVTVTTTGGVNLSIDPPAGITAPVGDASTTTWLPTYSVSGASNVAETSTASALSAAGSSTVNVNLTGSKTGAATFAAGAYAATLTLRCEP
ncbi:hypothetical protein [Consotaella salsifontis]|uniref:hypothetical protein n=1 Tax=Consotaella salsifontis TaxID=1365950 RepID=UPI00099A5D47|nr:hypothetical protein [Consotaella salsifontis]